MTYKGGNAVTKMLPTLIFDVTGVLDMLMLRELLSILTSPKNVFHEQIVNNIKIRCTELVL